MPSHLLFVVALLPIFCHSSPINRQVGLDDNVFMAVQNTTDVLDHRVCFIDAVTYLDGETIPTSSPCEHCVCRPPGFACTITSCEYRPGCKAFRRSDQCCPEYQCECEKDGKIYQNGEKIMDTNNPCEVCYCQGGEIICAVIDCYWRNDCPPRYIDNRCCPMYDHCPPPSAQGPIRHRLPSVPSLSSPITWHNISQSIILTSEIPTTSTTTTTPLPTSELTTSQSTTTAPLSSSSVAPPESENEVLQDHYVDPVRNDIPAIENLVNDDAVESSRLDVPSTSASSIDATPTSYVVESTTMIIPAVLKLTVQPTRVQPIQIIGQSTLAPSDVIVAFNEVADVATTSEASQDVVKNDNVPEIDVPMAEEKILLEDEPLPTEQPVPVTERVASEAAQTTLSYSVNEINSEVKSNELVRNDLPDVTTSPYFLDGSEDAAPTPAPIISKESQEETVYSDAHEEVTTSRPTAEEEVQNDATESLPIVAVEVQELHFDDSVAEVTTSGVVEAIQNDDVTSPPATVFPDETVALPKEEVQFDGTQSPIQPQSDSTVSPVSNDISEEAQIVHDATEETTVRRVQDEEDHDEAQNDATEVTSDNHVENEEILQDETYGITTEGSVISHDIESESVQRDQENITENIDLPVYNDGTEIPPVSQDSADVPAHDNAEPVFYVTTEPAIVQDEPSLDATEANLVPQYVAVNEESPVQDEPVTIGVPQALDDTTEQIYAREDEATESNLVENDEVAVTSQPPESLSDATETLFDNDEEGQTVSPVNDEKKAIQDVSATTAAPIPPEPAPFNDNQGFEIILDDEVIPDQPEILNQIRDVNEIQSHNNQQETEVVNKVNPEEGPKEAESFYPGVRVADHDTIEIVNPAAAAPLREEEPIPEITTQSPVQRTAGQAAVQNNGESNTAAEIIPSNDEVFSDDLPEISTSNPSAHFNDETENGVQTTEGTVEFVSNDDTTERIFRTDILNDHLGVPHDHEDGDVSTVPSVVPNKNEETAEVVFSDDSQPTTSLPVLNKVEKVAAVLSKFAQPGSEESLGNQFRLELDIFRGSNEIPESIEQNLEERHDESPFTTTVETLDDAPVTSQPENAKRHDLVESDVVTEAIVVNDEPVTVKSQEADVAHDEEEQEQVTVVSENFNDEAEPSTVLPVQDDEEFVQNDAVTYPPNSYSFRMEIINSKEESAENLKSDDVPTTHKPNAEVVNDQAESATESVQLFRKDSTSPPVAILSEQDNEIAIEDEPVTTESISKFRTGLEDDLAVTEAAVFNDITEQNDFVEVTTSSSSGFQAEFREEPTEHGHVADEVVTERVMELAIENNPEIANDATERVFRTDILHDHLGVPHDHEEDASTVVPLHSNAADETVAITSEPFVNDAPPQTPEENATPVFEQQHELRIEPVGISFEDTTVVGVNNDDNNAASNNSLGDSTVVFADEVVTTAQPEERLRTESVVQFEQQTEAAQEQVEPLADNVEEEVTTEPSQVTQKPVNATTHSFRMNAKLTKEQVALPERGLPKIQPFSPELLSRNDNPHEKLRFDLQLPPEKDSSWLSRAVNQFRKLAIFNAGNSGKSSGSTGSPSRTSTRSQNHRFLLF